MKTKVIVLMAIVLPQWLMVSVVHGAQEQERRQSAFVVFSGDDGVQRHAQAVVLRKGEDEAGERTWLGVTLGEVPEPLVAQFDRTGDGVMVHNVVKGSPADEAGLAAHDIILAIDGEPVEGQAARTVELVRSRAPGDVVSLLLLRGGQETEIEATLSSSADAPDFGFAWKFHTAPEAEVEEQVMTRGRILRRDDNGEWIMEDLGDVHTLESLPDKLKMAVPHAGTRSTQFFVERGEKKIKTTITRDGATITVEREGDGPITVTRVDEKGIETITPYADEDELKAADEEAFELYRDTIREQSFRMRFFGPGAAVDFDFDGRFHFDPDALREHAQLWKEQLESGLGEARESYERAMTELRERLEQWEAEGKLTEEFPFEGLPHFLFRHDGEKSPGAFAFAFGKPRHTFEVRTDGTIEVCIRTGDSELVQLFSDEDDLARRAPDLYEKYERLMSAGERE